MSRGFVKDGDIEEVPAVEQRAWIPEGVVNYVTPEGLALLNAEREALVLQRDGASGNETDLRVTRNYLNAKLQLLDERIASAVVPQIGASQETVGFGAYVTVRIDGGKNRTFRIVGAVEADASKGLISFFSPVAKAIAGRRAGEAVTSGLSAGNREIEVVEISYEPVPLTVAQVKAAPRKESSKPQAAAVKVAEHESPAVVDPKPEAARPAVEKKDDPFEILPLVNERGVTVGRATRKECHNGTKLLHPVVHLHLFNSEGGLYLQKRPLWKDIQPGMWDTAVGGHIRFGEPVAEALRREVEEEIGLVGLEPVLLGKYIFESSRVREFVNVFKAVSDGAPVPGDEVEEGRFWSLEEIAANLGKKVFTPNFELEYKKFFGKK